MKKNILFLIMVFSVYSCSSDFLEKKSTEAVTEDSAFATTGNAMAALNGLHRLMYTPGGTQNYCGFETMIIMNDMMGEDMVFLFSNTYFLSAYKFDLHRTESSAMLRYLYRYHYSILVNASKIIAYVDDAVGPQADKDYIKAQALVYRAFMHFCLVQWWGERYEPGKVNSQPGIPMILEDTVEPQPRSSVEDVYASINLDLGHAIALFAGLPGGYKTPTNKIHININVAKGMKARVALTQGNWQDAAQFAKEARQGYELSLSTYTEHPRFTNQSNPEWMWGTKVINDQAGGWATYVCYIGDVNCAVNRAGPKGVWNHLYSQISDSDVRKGIFAASKEIAEAEFSTALNGKYAKYMHNKYLVADKTSTAADCPYMRAPEMILIEAEALARQGKEEEARNVLFELANFRDPEYRLSINKGQALVEEIWLQRRIELWGEGFRFLDLKRNNLPLDRNPGNGDEVTNHNGTLAKVFNIPAGDNRWQYLFPERELLENPHIGKENQNP